LKARSPATSFSRLLHAGGPSLFFPSHIRQTVCSFNTASRLSPPPIGLLPVIFSLSFGLILCGQPPLRRRRPLHLFSPYLHLVGYSSSPLPHCQSRFPLSVKPPHQVSSRGSGLLHIRPSPEAFYAPSLLKASQTPPLPLSSSLFPVGIGLGGVGPPLSAELTAASNSGWGPGNSSDVWWSPPPRLVPAPGTSPLFLSLFSQYGLCWHLKGYTGRTPS